MKRVRFATAFAAVALVAFAGIANADGPSPSKAGAVPKNIAQYMVTTVRSGHVETPGFNPAGFTGDVVAVKRQAAGLNQTSAAAATAYTSCRTYTAYLDGYSVVGIRVWRFNHSVYWCYNGTSIVGTPTSWIWASNLAPGWRYAGQISSSAYWRPWPTQYYVWRQGKFQLCFQWCVQEVHPWISWLLLWEGSSNYNVGR